MLFFVTRSVMGFRELVVADRAAYAAHIELLANRESEVCSRLCAFNSDSTRPRIQ
jgi:hypothetical protein